MSVQIVQPILYTYEGTVIAEGHAEAVRVLHKKVLEHSKVQDCVMLGCEHCSKTRWSIRGVKELRDAGKALRHDRWVFLEMHAQRDVEIPGVFSLYS